MKTRTVVLLIVGAVILVGIIVTAISIAVSTTSNMREVYIEACVKAGGSQADCEEGAP